jgi:hypothetical protein
VDQWERFRLGRRVLAETYFQRFPPVANNPVHAIDLVFAEYLIREGLGEHPTLEEYLQRFPCYAEELRLQIELYQAMATHQKTVSGQLEHVATLFDPDQAGVCSESQDFPDIPGFDVESVLGRGGAGVVYRGWQHELNRPVALKMLHTGSQTDPQILARFCIEAEAVARLHHPNIVQIHDVGRHAVPGP